MIPVLMRHEGVKEKIYNDHLGNPTIGVGFLVSALSETELDIIGVASHDEVKEIDEEQIFKILRLKLQKLIYELDDKLPWFFDRPIQIQYAVLDMAYQLGVGGLLKFKRFLDALENKEYLRAQLEAKNSRWAKQTPTRCQYVCDRISEVVLLG